MTKEVSTWILCSSARKATSRSFVNLSDRLNRRSDSIWRRLSRFDCAGGGEPFARRSGRWAEASAILISAVAMAKVVCFQSCGAAAEL